MEKLLTVLVLKSPLSLPTSHFEVLIRLKR
jgi:hypothetical protein